MIGAAEGVADRADEVVEEQTTHRDVVSAQATLAGAETVASATGERVWDAQPSARRLWLSARQRTQGDLQGP